jgi:predicted MFS family arabinose efflux permease
MMLGSSLPTHIATATKWPCVFLAVCALAAIGGASSRQGLPTGASPSRHPPPSVALMAIEFDRSEFAPIRSFSRRFSVRHPNPSAIF